MAPESQERASAGKKGKQERGARYAGGKIPIKEETKTPIQPKAKRKFREQESDECQLHVLVKGRALTHPLRRRKSNWARKQKGKQAPIN